MKDALLRVIDAALTAKELDEKMLAMGYGKTPYSEIYGKLEEALYIISGESDGMEFEGSMTQTVLTNPILCMERRAAILEHVRIANTKTKDSVQPSPDFISRDEMRQMVSENGGYVAPNGCVVSTNERGLKRENNRLKHVNKILMDKLCGAAVEVCMGCKCCKSEDASVRSNCDMCDYAYLKERKLPPHMTKEFLP